MANDNPTFFSDHHTPRRTDAIWAINQKILGALVDLNGGGGGIPLSLPTCGSGSPEGVVDGNCGRPYVDNDTGAKYSKTTGAGTLTGWV